MSHSSGRPIYRKQAPAHFYARAWEPNFGIVRPGVSPEIHSLMKKTIVTANSQSMRAYRLTSKFKRDHFDFEAVEIDLPPDAASARHYQDDGHRLSEMAHSIDNLIASEEPESWSLAAPAGIFAHLLPLLSKSSKQLLCGGRKDDLVALPAKQIANRFAPSNATA